MVTPANHITGSKSWLFQQIACLVIIVQVCVDHMCQNLARNDSTVCTQFAFILAIQQLISLYRVTSVDDFSAMHLPAKFHHPVFTRSEVIVLTNTHAHAQTHKQTDPAENIQRSSLCYNAVTHHCPDDYSSVGGE